MLRHIKRLWLIAFVLIALVLIGRYLYQERSAVDDLLQANPAMLGVGVVAWLGYLITTVLTWRRLLGAICGRMLDAWTCFVQIVMVNLGKYVPGKVWGFVARGSVLTRQDVDKSHIVDASIAEQFYLLFTAGLVVAGGFAIVLGGWQAWLAVVALLPIVVTSQIWLSWGFSIWRKVFKRAEQSSDTKLSASTSIEITLRYVGVWVFLGLSFGAIAIAVTGVEITPASLAWFVIANTVGYVAGFIAIFAPGGIGVRESVGAGVLTSIMSLEQALIAVIVFRLFIVATELVMGALIGPGVLRDVRERAHT